MYLRDNKTIFYILKRVAIFSLSDCGPLNNILSRKIVWPTDRRIRCEGEYELMK